MQKARRHPENRAPTARRRTVSGSLSLPSKGCFSPFPHGTRPLSVSRECLALADGAAGFGQGSSDPALLRVPARSARVPRTGLSPATARPSRRLPLPSPVPLSPALQPRARLDARGLGWPPFARRYSGGHSCLPLLRLLGCFGSAGSPPPTGGCRALARRVAPFGNPRIQGRSRLPAEYRRLPRPSSPPGATGIPRAPSLACQPRDAQRDAADGATDRIARTGAHQAAARQHAARGLSSPPTMSMNRRGTPGETPRRAASWRMWGSNPRPPACKAGALAD